MNCLDGKKPTNVQAIVEVVTQPIMKKRRSVDGELTEEVIKSSVKLLSPKSSTLVAHFFPKKFWEYGRGGGAPPPSPHHVDVPKAL